MSDDTLDPMDAFEEVDVSGSPRASRRLPQGGIAHSTGLLPLNTNGSDQFAQLIQDSKLDPDTCQVVMRVNPITKIVSVEVVPPDTARSQAFRRNKDQRTFTFYLHAIYKKHPLLRPEGKIRVSVSRGVAKGKDCLLISLKGVSTRTTKREGEDESQSSLKVESQPPSKGQSRKKTG